MVSDEPFGYHQGYLDGHREGHHEGQKEGWAEAAHYGPDAYLLPADIRECCEVLREDATGEPDFPETYVLQAAVWQVLDYLGVLTP